MQFENVLVLGLGIAVFKLVFVLAGGEPHAHPVLEKKIQNCAITKDLIDVNTAVWLKNLNRNQTVFRA